FFMILSQVGEPDLAIASMAEESLTHWFNRKLPWTRYMVRYALSRIKGNLSEPRFFLQALALAVQTGEKQKLLPLLRGTMNVPEYALAWEFLRVRHLASYSPQNLVKLINAEAARITKRFPPKLDKSTYLYARSLSRRLYALGRLMERLPLRLPKYASLLDHITHTHRKWDKDLSSFASYQPSTSIPIIEQASRWNTDRGVARIKLMALKGAEGIFWKWFLKEVPN
ncbi:hypothetical protein KKF84_19755, partial [Myxococcota bacterium]|nr:hypothetical protein [Myxococcota bacterium]MBU1537560.1 hypothetical protein [Myxococcota bacterium]